MENSWVVILPGLLTGIAACIPLVIQFTKSIQALIKEKRWSKLVTLVADLMAVAEEKLVTGEDKKAWVMAMLKSSAEDLNISYDEKVVSDLIDSLVEMSKIVNAPKTTPEEENTPESEGVKPE